MWISKVLASEAKSSRAETGVVTLSGAQGAEVCATRQSRDFPVYAPYGYRYALPAGTSVLMVPSSRGDACCGSLMEKDMELKAGETALFSAGGASLYLKNNGSVIINGLEITRDGTIAE